MTLHKAGDAGESMFCRFKDYRCIVTRYEKLAGNFLGAIYFAVAITWRSWVPTLGQPSRLNTDQRRWPGWRHQHQEERSQRDALDRKRSHDR